MIHTFELGPIGFDENKRTGGGIARRLVQITPPTGFDPDYLTSILTDPAIEKSALVPVRPRQATVRRVVQNEVTTVFEVEATENRRNSSEQLDRSLEAIQLIVDAENGRVDNLQQTINEVIGTIFN
jgi:hypothetical protein